MIRRLTHSFAVLALLVPIGLTVDASTIRAQAPVATQAGQVALPDSPAGRALKAWRRFERTRLLEAVIDELSGAAGASRQAARA